MKKKNVVKKYVREKKTLHRTPIKSVKTIATKKEENSVSLAATKIEENSAIDSTLNKPAQDALVPKKQRKYKATPSVELENAVDENN